MSVDINPLIVEAFKPTAETPSVRSLATAPDTCLGSVAGGNRENQDRVAVVEHLAADSARSFRLYVVADGVGGLSAGGKCAEIAIATLVQSIITSREREFGVRLISGFIAANEQVFSIFKGDGATTLSVLAVSNGARIAYASVGDSRIYRYRSGDSPQTLDQLTEDDTIGNQVARAKGTALSRTSPSGIRGQLTQAIGSDEDITAELRSIRVADDDKFVLTTDGMHSIGHQNFLRVLANSYWPVQAVNRTAQLAEWLGSKDDVSGIFVGSLPPVEKENRAERPHGILRIHTPFGTAVFSRLSAIFSSETSKPRPKNQPTPSKKKGSKKKPSKKKRARKPKAAPKTEKEESQEENPADNEAAQQELEITYITADKG